MTVCASISPASTSELTVAFTTGMTADTSDTDATEGTDYTITTKSLTFPANDGKFSNVPRSWSSMTLPATVDKTFTLELSAGSGFTLGSQASTTVTITDVSPFIVWRSANFRISEDAGTDTTTVCARPDRAFTTTATTVPFTTSMTTDTSDVDATEGTDYTITTKSLTFPVNSTAWQCASISLTDDSDATGHKNFLLTLMGGGGGGGGFLSAK